MKKMDRWLNGLKIMFNELKNKIKKSKIRVNLIYLFNAIFTYFRDLLIWT